MSFCYGFCGRKAENSVLTVKQGNLWKFSGRKTVLPRARGGRGVVRGVISCFTPRTVGGAGFLKGVLFMGAEVVYIAHNR